MRRKISYLGLLVLAIACGSVPKGYQGDFSDSAKGVKISIANSEWTLNGSNGDVLTTSAQDMKYDSLAQGKSGVYMRPNPENAQMQDVFWVLPDMSTKQDGGGLVWYKAQVLYTLLDNNQTEAVGMIHMFRCKDGIVMLDQNSQTWQVGCPAGPETYDLTRVTK